MRVSAYNPQTTPPPPSPRVSHRGNPLRHREAFERGDGLRATDATTGLPEGVALQVLGFWNSPEEGMHVYLPVPAKPKHFRLAAEMDRLNEEVLLFQLPAELTVVCLRDCYDSLEYLPAAESEPVMRVSHRATEEERMSVETPHDERGQYLLFNVA